MNLSLMSPQLLKATVAFAAIVLAANPVAMMLDPKMD